MTYNVVLLNDVENSLTDLVSFFNTLSDIHLEIIPSIEGFHDFTEKKTVHLILANAQCRTLDPLSICQNVRASSPLRFLPFLYLNKAKDLKSIEIAYKLGANECISTPLNFNELSLRVHNHIRQYTTLKKCLLQNEKLASIITTDSLTKVSNRMHLQTILSQAIKEFTRYERIFSIIYFQINDIQKINAIYGFKKGDKFLKDIAQFVSKHVRESDITARWGGGDFIIFAPKTRLEDCDILLKKLNDELIKESVLKVYNTKINYGITQVKKDDTIYTIVERANKALAYSLKNGQIYTSML